MQRYNTDDLQKPNLMTRSIMERSTFIKWTLKVVGAFGVALILAGIFTHNLEYVALVNVLFHRWCSHSSPVNLRRNPRVRKPDLRSTDSKLIAV